MPPNDLHCAVSWCHFDDLGGEKTWCSCRFLRHNIMKDLRRWPHNFNVVRISSLALGILHFRTHSWLFHSKFKTKKLLICIFDPMNFFFGFFHPPPSPRNVAINLIYLCRIHFKGNATHSDVCMRFLILVCWNLISCLGKTEDLKSDLW